MIVRQMYVMLSSGRAISCGCSRLKPDKERDERLLALTNASRAKHVFKGTNIANIRTGHVSTKTKSGVKGVYQRANGKWIARIGFKSELIHLGTFDTEEEAKDARIEAEKKYYAPVIKEFNEIYNIDNKDD